MNKLVNKFLEKRAISTDIALNKPLHDSIYILEKSDELIFQLVSKNEKRLSASIPWAPIHDMYKRSYEYSCGALSCFLVAQLPSSEALCRTAVEGAVNLHFMSLGDSMSKQISYFKNYIKTKQEKNAYWKKSIVNSEYTSEEKQIHFDKISQKEKALNEYDRMLKESLGLAGINYRAHKKKWPNTIDRFREIGDEIGYRTVYASLCSQTHNDPEDILNQIMTRVIKDSDGLGEKVFWEQYHFSLMMITIAIRYHISASMAYLEQFSLDSSSLVSLHKDILDTSSFIIKNGINKL